MALQRAAAKLLALPAVDALFSAGPFDERRAAGRRLRPIRGRGAAPRVLRVNPAS